MSLKSDELSYLKSKIGRNPTDTELQIVAAEWSEHCSYKSSKIHLKKLPMSGPLVISEKGYDSGVLDVGDGYVVTVHIESHNHPSAVEPYGGAATGVGGVIRDILSAGTRPIAILDGLRFGDIEHDSHARWLFRSAVTGIADYGNCLGIPTIGGEVEFDESYSGYALVDVAAIGFGKKNRLIKNHAEPGDIVVLLGGPTGRDGIGGSQFASDSLEGEDRSAVQIPDPFIEKLIIEAILEARNQNLIHAMKDLGGGGLSCAVSETADALGIGIEMHVDRVHTREQDMSPPEIMVSESQERMLVITSKEKLGALEEICSKFEIVCSEMGTVTSNDEMRVNKGSETLASIPAGIIARAPLLDRESKKPRYLSEIPDDSGIVQPDLSDALLRLLGAPNIASKHWVYDQYDHEVGIRTVVRPGRDASVLRLDNGKHLAAKIDGNPKHCYLDPRHGAMGCFEEACRNVVCTGARPIGMVDHLQFGSPEDPEIFWTFLESLSGISDFAKHLGIPCVGGKVSFYNETPRGPIKPTPLIGVLGLVDGKPPLQGTAKTGDYMVIVGKTAKELGGSEYYEYIHKFVGGTAPLVDMNTSKKNMDAVLHVLQEGLVESAHDCSKGGIAVAASRMCMQDNIGCEISLDKIPAEKMRADCLIFSESHSRYLLSVKANNLEKLQKYLDESGIHHAVIGTFGSDRIAFTGSDCAVNLRVDKAYDTWIKSLGEKI